ncbi:TPA: phage tail tape measure protein [Escherichia coli]|nr:phage tail tape measure protein [Escherichia coli]
MAKVADGIRYAERVVAGEIVAGEFVRLACQRFLDDLKYGEERGIYFSEPRAQHILNFYKFVPHVKGALAGQPIELMDWHVFILINIFGFVIPLVNEETGEVVMRSDGSGRPVMVRRFRTAYNEVARKNAKSTLSSGIGLYMTGADGEGGAEVYSAATTRDQARIVFEDAKNMVRKARSTLGRLFDFNKLAIYQEQSASKFEPLSSDANNLDGLNIHCAIIDELHAHKTRDVWDVLETATGARLQSLLFGITTAGFNKEGICYEQRDYAIKVLRGYNSDVEGAVKDDSYFAIIYTLDTEFNRLLGLGNELLQQRQGLVNVPLRLPQTTLDDKQQTALNNSKRELALSRLKGEARERARLGYAADDLGFVGEAYQTARQNYINNSLDAWRNNQANKPKAHKKTEAEKTEDIYKRLIKQQKEQIALAGQNTELAKMKYQVSQGELSTLSEAQKKTLLQNAALIDQKKIREQLAAYESSLADSNASTRASNDAQLLGYGEGSRMRERLQEMWSIRHEFEQKNNELLRQYQAGEIEEALWKQEKELNKKYLEERLSDQQDYYAKADALRNNWNAGLQEGLTNWADSATDYASQAADAVVSTMDGLVSNISDALAGNVVDWRNWGSSILQEVSKILMNAAIVNGLKSLSGAGGWLGTVGGWISGAVANAKGGVYTSANLSAYSNTIVDTPTYFAFAKGAGLMGEAGPEAIMPLTRAADGSLGVRAIGNVNSGGGFVYSPVYHISIQNQGSNGEIDARSARGLVDLIDSRVVSIMQSSRRDGGLYSA